QPFSVAHKCENIGKLKKLAFSSGSFVNDINSRLMLSIQFGLVSQEGLASEAPSPQQNNAFWRR
ncbi:hypothetical protein IJH72_01570, partial [Candidatus Saccharibacteria bacterium]|nr:hypothetical protein [Candidatus Saccharibacteria bacterium]